MKKESIFVAAAVIFKDGCILAAQKGYGEFKGKWEFPGGKVKDGETSEEAVRREIKEELNADLDIVQPFRTIYYKYPNFNLEMKVFRCTLKNDISFVYHDKDHLEHDNLIWLDIEDLDKLDWLPADIKVVNELRESFCLDYLPQMDNIGISNKDVEVRGVENETVIRHR